MFVTVKRLSLIYYILAPTPLLAHLFLQRWLGHLWATTKEIPEHTKGMLWVIYGVSVILTLVGVVLIFQAVRRKEKILGLVLATLLASLYPLSPYLFWLYLRFWPWATLG